MQGAALARFDEEETKREEKMRNVMVAVLRRFGAKKSPVPAREDEEEEREVQVLERMEMKNEMGRVIYKAIWERTKMPFLS